MDFSLSRRQPLHQLWHQNLVNRGDDGNVHSQRSYPAKYYHICGRKCLSDHRRRTSSYTDSHLGAAAPVTSKNALDLPAPLLQTAVDAAVQVCYGPGMSDDKDIDGARTADTVVVAFSDVHGDAGCRQAPGETVVADAVHTAAGHKRYAPTDSSEHAAGAVAGGGAGAAEK